MKLGGTQKTNSFFMVSLLCKQLCYGVRKKCGGHIYFTQSNGKYFMCLQLLQIFHWKLFKNLSKLYKDGLLIWFTYYSRKALNSYL